MTAAEFVSATYLRATGEVYSGTFGDDDSTKILALGNMEIDSWAKEDDWGSLYDPGVSIGTVSATDTFELDDEIRKISNQPDDYVQILKTDGQYSNYSTVEAKRLKRYPYGKYCAKVGTTLRFNKPFTADSPEFGGTLTVPAYLFADHLTSATSTVPVDDPNWLVVITAADWTQTDITLAQNRPDLVATADDLMQSMKQANKAQIEEIDKSPIGIATRW